MADITFNEDIVFNSVTYRYSPEAQPALTDIRLRIRRGESVGIVGTSGAGKSTLADLLLGLLEPTAGRVLVDGQNISRARRSWQRRIGYVAQSFYLLDESLRQNIAFGLGPDDINEARVAAAMKAAQLGGAGARGFQKVSIQESVKAGPDCRAENARAWRSPERVRGQPNVLCSMKRQRALDRLTGAMSSKRCLIAAA